MKYDFCVTIRDQDTGIATVVDFECQVAVSFDPEDGYVVDGAYLDGLSLIASKDQLTSWLGHRVMDMAEDDLKTRGPLYEAVTGHPRAAQTYNALHNLGAA